MQELTGRRTIRLRNFDYAASGFYFITICTWRRSCLFGEVIDGQIRLNRMGKIVANEWQKSASIRKEASLDESVIMPNHFHGILIIDKPEFSRSSAKRLDFKERNCGRPPVAPTGPQPYSTSAVIAGFKSAVTRRCRQIYQADKLRIWQRNYWEHVIRNERQLQALREYIRENPRQWQRDSLHPENFENLR